MMAGVRVVETHISYLFLVGDRAYKLKKPVTFPFVDQSTREARERFCHREVELNRRLTPDVYLRVLDIADDGGQPIDHLVEMRRMPDEQRLSALVRAGVDVDRCLRQLAHDLAAFHSAADSSAEISSYASGDAVEEMWSRNLAETEPFVGRVLDRAAFERITTRVGRYMAGREPLFLSRATSRHARDGHGDLLADDVFCLDDGPRVLDCIEFDDHLRWGDVVSDVAFLAMDLERIGAADAADRFLAWYREFSGETYPSSLSDLYIAYRASVRAKVACLKHEQGDAPSRDRARELIDLCDRRLARGRIRLMLIGGLPGTGKSTVAEDLSDRTGWTVLRSDEIRKDITGTEHSSTERHTFGEGIYSDEVTARTYAVMLSHARALLEHGETVILDASWVSAAERARAADLAEATASDLIEIRCVLDADTAAERMRRRRDEETDPSDADADVARAMAAVMDPWPNALDLDTDRSVDDAVADAIRATA
jgi:hypothetical protein